MSSLSSSPSSPSGERAGAGPRLLRAAVFAAVCVALSATGHALAACAGVPWWTLLAGFAGALALVLPFTGRTRSLPATTLALGAGQLALHLLFGTAQRHESGSAPGGDDALIRLAADLVCGAGPVDLTADDAHRIVTLAGLTPPAHGAESAVAAAGPLPSLPMLLAHLLAALVTGWLLRHSDLALDRLTRLSTASAREFAGECAEAADAARLRPLRAALRLVRALFGGLVRGTGAPHTPRRAVDDPPPPMAAEALQHAVIRRGPPADGYALAV
ncbi:hypothetical protein ACFVIM_02820 [Streptomyces sp. NPDC057638]|uniref:hypothetical protein n=1 Tax=Streptomyces sp. NPDC057638 TaxID=3346190 RepID=UPI00368D8BBB